MVATDCLKQHIKHQIDDFLVQLQDQFRIEFVEVGGIDFSVWKIYLKALWSPKTLKKVTYKDINLTSRVLPFEKELVNEVKKVGVIIDRDTEL